MSTPDRITFLDKKRELEERLALISPMTCSVHGITVRGWEEAEKHDAEFH